MRHLPAALETNQAANVARVVPSSAKLVKVGKAVLGYVAKPARTKRARSLDQLRMAEIERQITARHGPHGVDTDDGASYLEVAVPHLIALPAKHAGSERISMTPTAALVGWAARWTPKVEAPLVW